MAPRAAGEIRLRLKRERGAYRSCCLRSRRTAKELAAARGVLRSNARGVRAAPVSSLPPVALSAATLQATPRGRSRHLPEGHDVTRWAWRVC